MDDQDFIKRIAEYDSKFNIRSETQSMIRDELKEFGFCRDVEKFVMSLRRLPGLMLGLAPEDRWEASLQKQQKQAQALADLAGKLDSFLKLSDFSTTISLDIDKVLSVPEEDSGLFIDSLRSQLHILSSAAAHYAPDHAKDESKISPGPKNNQARIFVALIAFHWLKTMPDTPMKPSGAFKRICEGIVKLEGLPFKISRPAIKEGLLISPRLAGLCE
jgi:hypothetical protein